MQSTGGNLLQDLGDHADFNGDNVVNLLDVGILKQTFLKVPGPAGILP